jgi:hypothetical protein
MPSYRPSCALRFVIRLDEGGSTADLLRELQALKTVTSGISISNGTSGASASDTVNATHRQVSTLSKLSQLTGESSPALRSELEKALEKKRAAQRVASGAGGTPDAVHGAAPDRLTMASFGGVPALRAEIQRAGFRTMDKASFTLNYFEAPFDPRLMRAAAVEISIGVVSEIEFDAGMHGLRRPDGSLYSQVEDPEGLRAGTKFFGFVDRWDIDITEEGAVVHGSAQDAMSLIRDTPLPADAEIDLDVPLEQGIKKLLDSFPSLRGIPVSFGDGEVGPIPGSAGARKKKLVGKKGHKRYKRVGENTNVWDYITDVCTASGVIPVVEAYGLRIQAARTLYGKRPQAPSMVWGRNLESLRFSRALSGFKNPTVEVRCYQQDKQQTFAARYPAGPGYETAIIGVKDFPKKPDRASRVTPSGSNPDEPIRVFVVANVADFERLRAIARSLFEETARQEIEVNFTTKDPSSFQVDFAAADLLDLKAGDPVRILMDARRQGALADNVTALQGMTPAERVQHLIEAGYKRNVAITYAALLAQENMQTIFRTQMVRLTMDHEEGLSIDVDAVNYITVRDDASRSDDIQAGPSPEASARTSGQDGAGARRLRSRSAARRTADAQAQSNTAPPASSSQQGEERFAAQTQSELVSDPGQLFSQ